MVDVWVSGDSGSGDYSARASTCGSPDEWDAVFEVPLSLFSQPPSRYFERGAIRLPSYDFEDFHIWGLTAMMIAEFMNNFWDADISLKY